MIPVKWTAPEAIHFKKYSTASDVWSYGCLLYEIWSMGTKPFEGLGNSEVNKSIHLIHQYLKVLVPYKVVKKIDSGYRLPPPPGCPLLVYQLMIQCWYVGWIHACHCMTECTIQCHTCRLCITLHNYMLYTLLH